MTGGGRILVPAGLVLALIVSGSCGSSPMSPGPVTPPVTAVNTPPVVESIVASATRAEVETDVTITATVRDAETPVAQLKYQWKADAGTFTGEGRVGEMAGAERRDDSG